MLFITLTFCILALCPIKKPIFLHSERVAFVCIFRGMNEHIQLRKKFAGAFSLAVTAEIEPGFWCIAINGQFSLCSVLRQISLQVCMDII